MTNSKEFKKKLDQAVVQGHMIDCMELVQSYAISAREAAWRGDMVTLEMHLKQLRLVIIEGLQAMKEMKG